RCCCHWRGGPNQQHGALARHEKGQPAHPGNHRIAHDPDRVASSCSALPPGRGY
ncbi:hypothetical protein BN1723_020009, partial [Verticillium longisporum]